MPRELRKRGKRKGKKENDPEVELPHEQAPTAAPDFVPLEDDSAGPSWISANNTLDAKNIEAPFGYVEADLQAYFRSVDLKIREWQDEHGPGEWNEQLDVDPIEGAPSLYPQMHTVFDSILFGLQIGDFS